MNDSKGTYLYASIFTRRSRRGRDDGGGVYYSIARKSQRIVAIIATKFYRMITRDVDAWDVATIRPSRLRRKRCRVRRNQRREREQQGQRRQEPLAGQRRQAAPLAPLDSCAQCR